MFGVFELAVRAGKGLAGEPPGAMVGFVVDGGVIAVLGKDLGGGGDALGLSILDLPSGVWNICLDLRRGVPFAS